MNIINRFTLQTLKKNKIRTLVTIVGIILSTAMFTGVTSIVTSLQQYIVNLEIAGNGAWEGRVNQLSKKQAEQFQKEDDVKEDTVVGTVGYARLQGSLNEGKPYLCIQSVNKDFTKLSSLTITQGRMAEKEDELVLSSHLEENGGITYHVGDTVTLEVGKRVVNGETAGQSIEYFDGMEKINDTQTKTYHIVGICERPPVEKISAPGYTAFTVNARDACLYDVLFTSKNPKEIEKTIKHFLIKKAGHQKASISEEIDYSVHKDLLRFRGKDSNNLFMSELWIMGGILICIIMVASVSLIYNAFSISVSERTKQFGLLKSIGATKKQIRHSVYFEALCLCVVGIPTGVIGGLLGIGVTLHFVGNLIKEFMSGSNDIPLRLAVMPGAIVLAVFVAIITVLVSSLIPARRAVRMTAIEALRENRDVRIRSKNVRSGKWVYRLFGFEGMLANKNFKRNRKKYRMTVFSLTISIILFVVTSCFNGYMTESVHVLEQENVADITLAVEKEDMAGVSMEEAKKGMANLQEVDAVAYSWGIDYSYLVLDKKDLSKEYYDLHFSEDNNVVSNVKDSDKVVVSAWLQFVDDDSYESYLKENHMDVSRFMDSKNLCPIIWDEVQMLNKDSTVMKCHILNKNYSPGAVYSINHVKGYEYTEDFSLIDEEKMQFSFVKLSDEEEENAEEVKLSGEKAASKVSFVDTKLIDNSSQKPPLGIGSVNVWADRVTMVLPYSAMEYLPQNIGFSEFREFNFKAGNYKKAYTMLSDYIKNSSGFTKETVSKLYSYREMADASKAMLLVMDIFVYGFIVLISMIVVANIFNTISTNIQLRRKEFAMLKSVGMARKGFDRMMNFECLLYGVKSLLIGLPISFLLCYLMCRALQVGWNLTFSIPWSSVGIVVVSVFVVVFVSMLYSMRKIKKDNPIEALRNDNL